MDPSRVFPKGGWRVRYRDDKGGTTSRTFLTKQDALDFQASVRADKRRGDFIGQDKARTPFADVAERWHTLRKRTPATLAGYRSILDTHLIPAFGTWAIKRIQPSDIEAMLAESGVSAKTQRNILRVLSPIMKLAVRDGMIRTNPCPLVEMNGDGAASKKPEFLTAEQVRDLADEITAPFSTLIYFAAYTGMRAGEIVALRCKNLDLMQRRVHVKESATAVNGTIHTGPTKTKQERTVAFPAFLTDALMAQTADKDQESYVFPGSNGGPMRHGNFYNRHFRSAVKRLVECGDWPEKLRELRFHDLRHTCASLLIRKGLQPLVISRQLGHSSIAITMDRYGHLYPEDQDLVAQALDAIAKAVAPSAPAQVSSLR